MQIVTIPNNLKIITSHPYCISKASCDKFYTIYGNFCGDNSKEGSDSNSVCDLVDISKYNTISYC